MDPTTKRDVLTHLYDSARVEGVSYLFALISLGRFTISEMVDLTGDERHRIGKYMRRLESRGYAQRVQNGRDELWYPTPRAIELLTGKMMVENLPSLPSSSSDQINQNQESLIRSDPEEEEARRQKIYLNREYGLTGEAAAKIADDPDVTPLLLVAWMGQVGQMKRDGFRFTKSPEAYAIRCLLRHDEPNREALHLAPRTLDQHLRWMPHDDDEDDSEEEDTDA